MDKEDTVRKRDVRDGRVYWLRKDAHVQDATAFRRSGLVRGALNHPVVVVDALSDWHDYVWVCLVSAGISTRTGIDIN